MNTSLHNKVFWEDRRYWLALLAGPISWCLLYVVGQSVGTPSTPWLVFFKLALLYPILEEIVFRGGVQTFLLERDLFRKRLYGISYANIITALVFAAAHLIHQPILWASLVFVPGLIFGWARERYDSLLPPIILHAFYNAGFVLLFTRL